MSHLATEYETDFNHWIQHQIELLKQGRMNEIDVVHLIEELEDMGKSNKRELASRLVPLISHLLKWKYQYQQLQDRWKTFTGGSWRGTIKVQREQFNSLLADSPSLKRELSEAIIKAYPIAMEVASDETGLPQSTFPEKCPFSMEQLLDKHFYP
jgi:hypothetical protein